jgi:biotin-(acetyl-CoA carboxylase) ligase
MQRAGRRRNSKRDMHALDLPPPFRLVVLREIGDAFAYARAHAAELGAGTFVFVGRFDLAEFAVVLQPEERLALGRRAFYACMVALCDALAAPAPPEKSIAIEWPDAVYVDGGLIGGGRLAWPDQADERAVPDWLVFGALIRIVSLNRENSGVLSLSTALADESFDLSAERLAEAFTRHLMVAVDRWQEGGFALIEREYIARLRPERGARCNIGESGDLAVQRSGKRTECRKLLPALKAPGWLDPRTGGPRL